jgi:hypothetical protein
LDSGNTIEVPVPSPANPPKVTDQAVPVGKPDSVNVTTYFPGGSAAKVTVWASSVPLTVMLPEAGVETKPETDPTVKE